MQHLDFLASSFFQKGLGATLLSSWGYNSLSAWVWAHQAPGQIKLPSEDPDQILYLINFPGQAVCATNLVLHMSKVAGLDYYLGFVGRNSA